jgi:hypothetical protein
MSWAGARRNSNLSVSKANDKVKGVLIVSATGLSFGGHTEVSMLAPLSILFLLAAVWAEVTAAECDPILTLEGEEWVVTSCSPPIEGQVERPSVEFVLEPTRIHLGPLPSYSPLHALEPDS